MRNVSEIDSPSHKIERQHPVKVVRARVRVSSIRSILSGQHNRQHPTFENRGRRVCANMQCVCTHCLVMLRERYCSHSVFRKWATAPFNSANGINDRSQWSIGQPVPHGSMMQSTCEAMWNPYWIVSIECRGQWNDLQPVHLDQAHISQQHGTWAGIRLEIGASRFMCVYGETSKWTDRNVSFAMGQT